MDSSSSSSSSGSSFSSGSSLESERQMELLSWGDAAMYRSEPMPVEAMVKGPRVYLLSMTEDPLGVIAAGSMMYEGRVTRNLASVSDEDRRHYFQQITKTHLKAPFELVNFHFLIEGVTRAFTHQIVRQRTACLAGDTVVYSERRNKRYSLEELWDTWNRPGGRTWVKNLHIRTVTDSGMIVTERVAHVSQSGVKPVYRLQTHDGKTIKATKDHLFWTPEGDWKELGELSVGDHVVANGIELVRDEIWLKQKVADGLDTLQIAALANCSTSHVKKFRRMYGIPAASGVPVGFVHSEESRQNMSNAPRSKWSEGAKAAFSKWCLENRDGQDPDSWDGVDPGHRMARYLYSHLLERGCAWCGEEAKELAHLDSNPTNNEEGNVQPMCKPCHRAMDRGALPRKTYPATIVSIEYIGEEMTYDLGMEGSYKRFVANGLVVHNCFMQESLRFAVKENLDEETPVPPSLRGLPDDDPKVRVWRRTVNHIQDGYEALIGAGIPAEDARGLLPHSTLTRLHYACDLRALQEHGGNRLCTQAQHEWKAVWIQIVEAIRKYGAGSPSSWQFELLADMFRPVCYLTGKCEFMASFDRPCAIRDRVQANHSAGRDSSLWSEPFVMEVAGRSSSVAGIHPIEWLDNINAAK